MEALTNVPGFSIGHWTDEQARTGCTVLSFDRPTLAACDVRGAAPGSRELALLAPGRAAQQPNAILLTGGSAFGLAAADGVMRWLKQQNRGLSTPAGLVPLVPAAVIFDLMVGDSSWPDADAGYRAIETAGELSNAATGSIGAGTGATYGHIRGSGHSRRGGIAISQIMIDQGSVTAVVVLNAFGDSAASGTDDPRQALLDRPIVPPIGESTTLMACVTDIPLDHNTLQYVTVAMHDGLARSIVPAHTMVDGDIAFAVSLDNASSVRIGQAFRVALAAEIAIEFAIRELTAAP
jgi:L-aminopeptidase/D-esterase-like protein